MPYFNDGGEMNPDSPDLLYGDVADHITEPDRQAQDDRARREAIGTGKKPGEAAPEAAPLPPGFPALATAAELEQFRAEYLADPWHPMHSNPALAEHYAQAVSRLTGHEDGEEALGTLHDGKILRPEDNPPVRIPELSEDARAAFGLDAAEATAVVEHQEALVDLADESGLPRYHVESLIQDVGAAMEDLARDDYDDTREGGVAELVRLEGAGRARQIITDAQQLAQLLHDSGHPNLVAAAEDLIATSNHPRVLIGAARLYQELKSLPPQGPWDQLLLGRGTKWAQQQSAAQARAEKNATADQTPDDHIVVQHGRP